MSDDERDRYRKALQQVNAYYQNGWPDSLKDQEQIHFIVANALGPEHGAPRNDD